MITGVSPLRAQPVAQAVKSGPVKGSLRLSGRADRQPHNRPSKLVRADPPDRADFAQELEDFDKEFVGLLPDEDHEVPGGYTDSLSQNTKLGRAVNDACLELDALGKLEKENLEKANDLLRQLGYRGNLFKADGATNEQ